MYLMISIRHSVGFIKPMRTQNEILWEKLARVHNWWGSHGVKGGFQSNHIPKQESGFC